MYIWSFFVQVAWVQPKDHGDKPEPRSGHSITVVSEKAVVFGGCGVHDGNPRVFNDTYLLHISEGFRWERLAPAGQVPSERWRHTATHVPTRDSVFVFGGLCKGKRLNDSFLFNLSTHEWSEAEVIP